MSWLEQEKMPADAFNALCADLLRHGKTIRLKPLGGSMSPVLRPTDVVDIEAANFQALRVGDIACVITTAGQLRIHRVVKKSIESGVKMLVTKGDAFRYAGEMVEESGVLGRAVRIRRGRRIIDISGLSRRKSGYLIARANYFFPELFHIFRNRIMARAYE